MSDRRAVPEVLADGLESVEGLLVPSFVGDQVGDTDAGTENKDIARGVVPDGAQMVAHVLFCVL